MKKCLFRFAGTGPAETKSSAGAVKMASVLLFLWFQNHPARANGYPPSFAPAQIYTPGTGAPTIEAGDFNGDGKPDLAVVNGGTNVSVLLGNGDGTFQTPINSSVGINVSSLITGDFNHDGRLDLALADNGNNLAILLGNGGGTFQEITNYSTSNDNNSGLTSYPTHLAVADFNRDGNPDLALANASWNNGTVLVFLGNGDGTLQPPTNYFCGETFSYRGDSWPAVCGTVFAGDFNGDGIADLAVGNWFDPVPGGGPATISMFFGNGDGTFQPAIVSRTTGLAVGCMAVGDFTGNSKLDMALCNWVNSYTTPFLLGHGDGTFQTITNQFAGVGSYPSFAVPADFNGDGKLDLAVLNPANTNVWILPGNGDGTFQGPFYFSVSGQPSALAVGDFNGDGRPDLAVAAPDGVAILLNICPCAGVHLSVTQTNAGLVLSWPLNYTNFVLESAVSPVSTNWQSVAASKTTYDGCCKIILPANRSQGFFRLRRP